MKLSGKGLTMVYGKLFLSLVLLAGWAVAITPWAEAAEGIRVHLRGSNTVVLLAQTVAESYMREHPDAIITVAGGGTYRGLKAVVDGTEEIGMASSPMDEELEKYAKEKGVELVEHIVAYDAIIPIVHPHNPMTDLSVAQLKAVYTGEINNWKELGGKDAPIVVTSHDVRSGTFEVWKQLIIGHDAVITPKARVMESKAMRQQVAAGANHIGYLALAYLDNSVKPLTVGGERPGTSEISNNKYPLLRALSLYTAKDAPSGAGEFIKYFLNTDKGQSIVKALGVFPAGGK